MCYSSEPLAPWTAIKESSYWQSIVDWNFIIVASLVGSWVLNRILSGLFFYRTCFFPHSFDCHTICDASYQLMVLACMTHLSDLSGGSRPPLSVHPLQDAAPSSQVMVCRPHLPLSDLHHLTVQVILSISHSITCFGAHVVPFSFIAARLFYCLSSRRLLLLLIFCDAFLPSRRFMLDCIVRTEFETQRLLVCGCWVYDGVLCVFWPAW